VGEINLNGNKSEIVKKVIKVEHKWEFMKLYKLRVRACFADIIFDPFPEITFNTYQRPLDFDSVIMGLKEQQVLNSYLPKGLYSKAKLLLRASRDGFEPKTFHEKCKKKPTVTIILTNHKHVFGGFTTQSWSITKKRYKRDPEAFLFLLKSSNANPQKWPIRPSQEKFAIFACSNYGPTFGNGFDIKINKSDKRYCYTNVGCTYNATPNPMLGGEKHSALENYEVYQLE